MDNAAAKAKTLWRIVVVGGHTRSIGKTQLVCDVIRAFPRTEWIAGKVTQYGHGVCAQNGADCDCAPAEHACALDWESRPDSGTDSSRFLAAGAGHSFWLRTKQGYLAEGMPLLRKALNSVASDEWRVASQTQAPTIGQLKSGDAMSQSVPTADTQKVRALIVESNSLMQFVKPSLYFAVIDPLKDDFKESAQTALDRASALVMRGEVGADSSPAPLWMRLPVQLMREKPSVLQREGEALPEPLWELVHRMLEGPPAAFL
jgi:hypothetical protein